MPISVHGLLQHVRQALDIRRGANVEGAIEGIRARAGIHADINWLLVCSAVLASIGLDTSSTAIVIGAMLVSPLMSPILGIGVGVATYDRNLLAAALRALVVMALAALASSTLYFLITPLGQPTTELLARTRPTLLDVGVAFFGGVAGLVAASRREATTAVPGVAIATALMPPLCTAGFGLATGRWSVALGAFYLFFLNAVFIATATYLIARLLHAPVVDLDGVRRRTQIERAIWAVVVVVTLPAAILLYDTVSEARMRRRAERFVEQHVAGDGREVVSWTYDGRRRWLEAQAPGTLKVLVAGRVLRSGEADSLNDMLSEAGLEGQRLRLVSLSGRGAEALTRADLLALLGPSGASIPSEPVATQPPSPPADTLDAGRLLAEARAFVPSLDTLGIAPGLRFSSAERDSTLTVFVRLRTSPDARDSAQERAVLEQLRTFLRVRTGVDSVRVATF